jgi:hypothetical protein
MVSEPRWMIMIMAVIIVASAVGLVSGSGHNSIHLKPGAVQTIIHSALRAYVAFC